MLWKIAVIYLKYWLSIEAGKVPDYIPAVGVFIYGECKLLSFICQFLLCPVGMLPQWIAGKVEKQLSASKNTEPDLKR